MKFEKGDKLSMVNADGGRLWGQVIKIVKHSNGAVKEYDVRLQTGTVVCYTPKQLNSVVEFTW